MKFGFENGKKTQKNGGPEKNGGDPDYYHPTMLFTLPKVNLRRSA